MIISITRKSGKTFFATLLVAGIIAIFSQSFMIGVHAQQEPGMYNYKDARVNVEKLKCYNDNFNIDVTNPRLLSQVTNALDFLINEERAEDSNKKFSIDQDIVLLCTNDNREIQLPVS